MPEDARELIETVYDTEREENVPAALDAIRARALGEQGAAGALAQLNAISLGQGYELEEGPDWWADSRTPTRLGEESVNVYLARREDGSLRPWCDAPRDAWALSRLQVPVNRLAAGTRTEEVELLRTSLPGKGRWCEVLVLEPAADGTWDALGHDQRGGAIDLRYCALRGLIYPHELAVEEI